MDKKRFYIHNGILLSHKKEWNDAICDTMQGPRVYHMKWCKSEREREIPQDITYMYFPGGTTGKEPACQFRIHEMWVWSLGQEDPLEKETAAHSSILAWRIPRDRGAWQATVHRVTESDISEQLSTLTQVKRYDCKGNWSSSKSEWTMSCIKCMEVICKNKPNA